MELSRNARTMPPRAAMGAARANANSFATMTSMPSDAAARSLVRTASSRRPLRPRLTFATTHTVNIAMPTTKIPYRAGWRIDPISKPNK